jgi:hypothetical protein
VLSTLAVQRVRENEGRIGRIGKLQILIVRRDRLGGVAGILIDAFLPIGARAIADRAVVVDDLGSVEPDL